MEDQNKIIQEGLSSDDVKKRQKKNLVNYDTSVPTKSIKKILFDNFFTIFNFFIFCNYFVIFLTCCIIFYQSCFLHLTFA